MLKEHLLVEHGIHERISCDCVMAAQVSLGVRALDSGGCTHRCSSTLQYVIQVEKGLLVIKLIDVIHSRLPPSLCALSASCSVLPLAACTRCRRA